MRPACPLKLCSRYIFREFLFRTIEHNDLPTAFRKAIGNNKSVLISQLRIGDPKSWSHYQTIELRPDVIDAFRTYLANSVVCSMTVDDVRGRICSLMDTVQVCENCRFCALSQTLISREASQRLIHGYEQKHACGSPLIKPKCHIGRENGLS